MIEQADYELEQCSDTESIRASVFKVRTSFRDFVFAIRPIDRNIEVSVKGSIFTVFCLYLGEKGSKCRVEGTSR